MIVFGERLDLFDGQYSFVDLGKCELGFRDYLGRCSREGPDTQSVASGCQAGGRNAQSGTRSAKPEDIPARTEVIGNG